jgi:hypothetical protein
MRRHHSPHQNLQSTSARQFDLFVPTSRDGAQEALPEWRMLPEETRQTLMSLLTRLILEHASGDHCSQAEEATL